jgi:hypothetical protein
MLLNCVMLSRALIVALASCQWWAAAVGGGWPHPTTTQGWGVHNILDYGATGDGRTVNTRSIQAAIDAAGDAGGGLVLLPAAGPPGNLTSYMSGSLFLRSNVRGRWLAVARDSGCGGVILYPSPFHLPHCRLRPPRCFSSCPTKRRWSSTWLQGRSCLVPWTRGTTIALTPPRTAT